MKKGIYKGIDVLIREHDSDRYYVEPNETMFDSENISNILECAGFVEQQMHWYKVIQKDDVDFHIFYT